MLRLDSDLEGGELGFTPYLDDLEGGARAIDRAGQNIQTRIRFFIYKIERLKIHRKLKEYNNKKKLFFKLQISTSYKLMTK